MKINKVLVSLVFLLLMSSIVYAGHVQVDRVVIKETLKTAKVAATLNPWFTTGTNPVRYSWLLIDTKW